MSSAAVGVSYGLGAAAASATAEELAQDASQLHACGCEYNCNTRCRPGTCRRANLVPIVPVNIIVTGGVRAQVAPPPRAGGWPRGGQRCDAA